MFNKLTISALAICFSMPALAQDASGDAAAGEKEFNKCKACHSVVSDAGEEIVKGGKVGPNLYGLAGRKAGSVDGFGYSDSIVAAGEAGLNWDEEHFVVYVQDATKFLREYLDDPKAKGKMVFKLRGEEEAANVWAYLASVGPQS
ncbi:cytochrome C [Sulfitobacter sp. LCG007]